MRENVLKIREGKVPDYFLLIECASEESIELGWEELIDSFCWSAEEGADNLCSDIISCARDGKNIHPLWLIHALEESERQRNVLERRLQKLFTEEPW